MAPSLPSAAAESLMAGFTSKIDKNQLRIGARLILSGRLTDVNTEAIAHAVIALIGIQTTSLSDADGRFLFLITVPPVMRLSCGSAHHQEGSCIKS